MNRMEPPPFSIRRATGKDAGGLARYRVDLFREIGQTPDAVAGGFEPLCRDVFMEMLAAGTGVDWIAEALPHRDLVGTLVLLRFPRLPTPKNPGTAEGYMVSVLVAPDWRQRGVASALVRSSIEYAKESGLARIRLHATPAGRSVYARLGFVTRDSEMELDLAPPSPPATAP